MSITDPTTFILANTRLQAVPHTPSIALWLADEVAPIWKLTEEELGAMGLPPPFWAFAWSGGQGLARHLLDHPEVVSGRRVVDFATGSGLVGIAAMKAGATSVLCADIDPFCGAAVALNAQANDVSYRKEQLRRLQEEVIELEDLKTGVSITDLGLNDFRMDLLNYVKAQGEPDRVPNGMHAVVPANPELGLEPGVIFTLRNLNPEVNVNQHNRLHPYYLVYIRRNGKVIHDHTEVKHLLDLVRSGCKGRSDPIPIACQAFNQETADGRNMQVYSELLSQSIRSMIEVKEEKDLDSLFTGGETTALTHTITGLDDFELVAFLVIQSADFTDEDLSADYADDCRF